MWVGTRLHSFAQMRLAIDPRTKVLKRLFLPLNRHVTSVKNQVTRTCEGLFIGSNLYSVLYVYMHTHTRTHIHVSISFCHRHVVLIMCPLLSSAIREVCIFPFCSRLFWQFWVLCINFKNCLFILTGLVSRLWAGWAFPVEHGRKGTWAPKLGAWACSVAVPRPQSTGLVGVVLGWLACGAGIFPDQRWNPCSLH